MRTYLEEEEQFISFRDYAADADDEPIYDIRRQDLNETFDMDNKKISAWVYRLCAMQWITRDMLERLCDIIKDEFPDNDIDWKETEIYINLLDQ